MTTTQETKTQQERVALGCLGCYNEGVLAFKWLTGDQLCAVMHSEEMGSIPIAQFVCKSDDPTHEEWHIQDYDGDISRLRLSENPDLDKLVQHLEHLEFHPEYIPAWLLEDDSCGMADPEPNDVLEVMENMVRIDRFNLGDWAHQYCEDCGLLDNKPINQYNDWHPNMYIDWERVAQDLLMDEHYIEYGEYYYARRD
jgi:antirestriction protein